MTTVNVGMQTRLEAKPGKEKELEEYLRAQLSFALGEAATTAWFATKLDNKTFGIFHAFYDASGLQAHLDGEICKALLGDVAHLLATPPVVENLSILAAKLPDHVEFPDTLG